MKILLSLLLAVTISICTLAADLNVGGTWEMTMDSPHGKITGPLVLEQDGAKITGTYETEHTGKLPINGKVDGEKITFSFEVPNMTVTFEGAKDGDKLSGTTKPLNGEWSAVRK